MSISQLTLPVAIGLDQTTGNLKETIWTVPVRDFFRPTFWAAYLVTLITK